MDQINIFIYNTKADVIKNKTSNNRRIKIVKLFIDVNNQKENFYICFYFN